MIFGTIKPGVTQTQRKNCVNYSIFSKLFPRLRSNFSKFWYSGNSESIWKIFSDTQPLSNQWVSSYFKIHPSIPLQIARRWSASSKIFQAINSPAQNSPCFRATFTLLKPRKTWLLASHCAIYLVVTKRWTGPISLYINTFFKKCSIHIHKKVNKRII